jgi:hypothetical protein
MIDVLEVKGHTGTVRFDGRTITILRKGLMARASVGKGEKQIPLPSVSAVQFKPAVPVVNGFIQFTVAGGNERRSKFGRQTVDAGRDENSVVFHYRQSKEFEQLRDAVQAALASHHGLQKAAPAPGIPEQIKQLAAARRAF